MFPFSIPWTQRELQRDRFVTQRTLAWSQDLALRPECLDAEHQRILECINRLLSMLATHDASRIGMAYNSLSAGAREHFASEEQRMRDAGFPDLLEHVDQHVELARRLAEVRMSMFSPYGSASRLGACPFLENWLVPHLRFGDKAFTDYLATIAPGVSPVARSEREPTQEADKQHASHEGS